MGVNDTNSNINYQTTNSFNNIDIRLIDFHEL